MAPPNNRLRSTLRASRFSEQNYAEELGIDRKTVQRWVTKGRTPHRNTAHRAADLLGVPVEWLWPDLEERRAGLDPSEVVAFYPHRSDTPKHLWLDLVASAREQIDLFANASLFLPRRIRKR